MLAESQELSSFEQTYGEKDVSLRLPSPAHPNPLSHGPAGQGDVDVP